MDKSIEIYVDGSYKDGIAKYAFIVVENNKEVFRQTGTVESEEGGWQVPGEVAAASEALSYITTHYEEGTAVTICYDYIGIEKWATGKWKANKSYNKAYSEKFRNISTLYKISFRHIKSHSGHKWNDLVDSLIDS